MKLWGRRNRVWDARSAIVVLEGGMVETRTQAVEHLAMEQLEQNNR